MSRINKFVKKRFDGVMILLVFFIVALSFLFLYLQNIDTHIRDYYQYKKTVSKLQVYNQAFDNTFIRSYRYLDNDMITETTKQFDRELIFLQKNKLTKEFGSKVIQTLDEIILKYQAKTELIESFKTLNSRITSSVYYLYELKKKLEHTANENHQLENLLGDILFKMGQIFLDTDLELLNIEKDLLNLNWHRTDEEVDYFYRHTKQILLDVGALNKIIKENEALHLDKSINHMNVILETEYLNNQKTEEYIGLIFFIFAFIILIFLINTYLKVLKKREEVFHLAYHDTLTNLPNRAEFERYISERITKKRRQKLIVLFLDLDRFKVINDTLGHDIGDEMLIVLGKRIARVLGSKNLLARIGGDEFVAVIESHKDMERVDALVAEITSVIRDVIHIREYSLNTTASIGIARYPEDGADKMTLLKHADSAMYHAKDNGGDTYAFYNEQLSVNIQRRLELEQELVHALKKEEFTLKYQPQYQLSTSKIIGVEALIRWKSDTLGEVSPEEFISVAEDTGMVVELGYFVFRAACVEYMRWKVMGIELDLMAINISSVQLRQADVFSRFQSILEETGMHAKNIEIELTERYIMESATEKLSILDDLRRLGCHISIDDFGTGYSSMSYLKSLEIDTIKIDKSFILDLQNNQHDAEVSKAIIALSQSLGYKVIAEGIETVEQENLLISYNCDMGQGYYFGKAMDSETFVDFYHAKQIL